MKLIYKILKLDQGTREGVVIATSALGIIVNILLATIKIVVGAAVSSIAIISEGINNASDSITALITIVGTKISNMHPTEKHPFGFGRVEFMTSLVISVLILFTGFELLKSSIELIIHPATLTISFVTLSIIAIFAVVKLVLGVYTISQGKKVDSGSLVALGTDCRNDSVISVLTLASALFFLISGLNIDAYVGVITSVFVLKAGAEILKETIGDLLGKAGDKDLANNLYNIIREEPFVLNAADMMLHNYGPDAYSGSVNIEIDHKHTVGEVYERIHNLQLRIMHEYNIVMVFGIYAVDHDHEMMKMLRKQIAAFIMEYDHVESYHALYLDDSTGDIYCDLVVDYSLENWDDLRRSFTEYINKLYPERRLELVIETKFV